MPTITSILSSQGHSAKTIKSLLQTGKVFLQGMPTADGRRDAKVSEVEVRPNAPRVKVFITSQKKINNKHHEIAKKINHSSRSLGFPSETLLV